MKILTWIETPFTGIAIVVGTFVLAGLIAAAGRPTQPVIVPTPALTYLIVIATPMPTIAPTAQPTPDMAMQIEIQTLKVRVAELEAERSAPQPQVVYQELLVQQAAPTVPAPDPGPQLQAVSVPADEEPLTDAQMREAEDK